MYDEIFDRLSKSDFRKKFKLSQKDRLYLQQKGFDTIKSHAVDFIAKRIAPADIPNDGKQTPMRGHPVFTAQHATATCCRGCINKWHKFPKYVQLTKEQQKYLVDLIMEWIKRQVN
ncbi:MAG TPA: DUF4186 domain-containing protein [Cyanobacteria bacterium UBA10660]|nr:MAG TPA: DUF4186 domain-containing protein [Candidatus Gastranaerophilales bacterium HUM_1]HAS94767.1 DUF4186 domain-containing protein [Cyanobacteria bacterium UBA10660]